MTFTFLFKLALVLLLLFVIFNLGRALYSMVKYDPEHPNSVPMSQFLGKRLFISVIVILVLLIGLASGLITPNDPPY